MSNTIQTVPEWRDGAQARSVDVMRLLTCRSSGPSVGRSFLVSPSVGRGRVPAKALRRSSKYEILSVVQ